MKDDHTTPRTLDEQRLRHLLSGAVQGLEPSDHALERLRHAVPARRTRKRRALVGAAAAVLLAGAAVPTALRMTGTASSSAAGHPAMAGHGEPRGGRTGGPSDPHQNGSGAYSKSTGPAGGHPEPGGTGPAPAPRPSGSPSGGTVADPTAGSTSTGTPGTQNPQLPPLGAVRGVPECTAGQLGVLGSARAPGADGAVYGSFKVTNVSDRGCLAAGPDTVTAAPAADSPPPAKSPAVTVVGHTAGDPASALLPDPSAESRSVVLQPNAAYEVRFAWVPSDRSCPAGTADPSAKPAQGGSGAPGATGPAAAADPLGGTTAPAPTGVEVSHTPAAGAPTTQATIPAACGGTVYRTGVIPLTQPTR
ncbi:MULTISPECIES: hypothetical protein [unclassified Streptomyces]|uniref:hypothetical protein n=1 Tax=unclassified Streptomyces TaxID=2593676 RepID=UPI002E3730C6|nr:MULTISPECIES: hypothetical protein [unclassified Streptomyces]WUC65787.1 hypothetical protein OG861_16940 [Streptomyces sp. NBC_00539]